MKIRLDRGASNWDAFLIILICIFALLVLPRSQSSVPSSTDTWVLGAPSSAGGSSISNDTSHNNVQVSNTSTVSLSPGNAGYSYQPYEEYVEIENWGSKSVDITGWQLKNGKDKRTYNLGGQLQRFSADIAVIPQASLLLSPTGASAKQNVILAPGERAILTTGSAPKTAGVSITSFKENMCTGYLETSDDYTFTPSLNKNCPRPSNEPGLSELEPSCRSFVESLSSCRTPEITRLDNQGKICDTCINGTKISSQCMAFVKSHFSYQGCVAVHGKDQGFTNTNTWRVYLGRSWEMWAESYESIEVFDKLGNLMGAQNY